VTGSSMFACGLVALLAAPASADEPIAKAGGREPSWRLIVGPSLFLPAFETSYSSTYAPPFELVPHTSTATQTMPLDAGVGPGVLLGLERALGRHVGLQLSAHYGVADLSGAPGRYDLSVRYTSRPPPTYDPVEVGVERTEAQPAVEGQMKSLAVSLDLVAWTDLGARGRLGLSVGPAWLRTKGHAERLVYTSYFLGGHSTLFSQEALVSFDFPSSTLGLDAGGFADVDLGSHVGLRFDLRYDWGPEQVSDVTLVEILNPDEMVRTLDLAGVEQALAAAPVRVDPSFFRASLALTVRF
jgi:hypothetical protein